MSVKERMLINFSDSFKQNKDIQIERKKLKVAVIVRSMRLVKQVDICG